MSPPQGHTISSALQFAWPTPLTVPVRMASWSGQRETQIQVRLIRLTFGSLHVRHRSLWFLCDFSHHQLSHRDAVEAAVMRLQLLALSEQRELSCAALQRAIEGMQRVASWHVSDVEKG